jgi:hypothetical protein
LGAGRKPTAAARRPTTQATLPSADHAAELSRLQRENERLRMERDILKKVDRDLCWGTEMRFRFIEDRRADYPVTVLCDVLGVSPSGYYAWRSRPESQRSATNWTIVDDIKRVHRDTSGRYGSPRIHAELQAQGRRVSRGRIERLIRHYGIRAIMARPRRGADHRQQP